MTEATLQLLSLGAGVQSTTLALMAASGDLTGLDGVIFADTGWEQRKVYDHLNRIETRLADVGIPLYRVSGGDIRTDTVTPGHRFASIPYYVRNPDGSLGMGRRQCTGEYKVKPIRRKIRELLGYTHPHRVPPDVYVEQWIGFSTDEVRRVDGNKIQPKYIRSRYPLLELGMDRKACRRWLHARGWTDVAKSSCVGCPFHGNREWRRLRDEAPAEWAAAVEFDRTIRKGGARARPLAGEAYLHASRLPLDQAPIDHVTRHEWNERQGDLLDILEDGDPDGCSPFGCRSGVPADASRGLAPGTTTETSYANSEDPHR